MIGLVAFLALIAFAAFVVGFSFGESSKQCAYSAFDSYALIFKNVRCAGRASTTCKAGCCALHHKDLCVDDDRVHCNPFAEPRSAA